MNKMRLLKLFIGKNSPTILAIGGSLGVIGTGWLAIVATKKTEPILVQLRKKYDGEKVPTKEIITNVAPFYIPTVIVGGMTITSILLGNRISIKRNAILTSMYSASELALKEYEKEVEKRVGKSVIQEVKDELAQKKLDDNPIKSSEVILTGVGKSLCYDAYTGRYFESDYESIRKVQNDINRTLITDMWACLNDVYYELKLPPVMCGEYVGFDIDNDLEFVYDSRISEDGRPCLVISFRKNPIPLR